MWCINPRTMSHILRGIANWSSLAGAEGKGCRNGCRATAGLSNAKRDFSFLAFPSSSGAVADSVSPDYPKPEGFLVHLAGHVLLFERRPAPDFDAPAGMRLLAIAIVVEAFRLVAPGGRRHAESPVVVGLPRLP